MFPDLLVDWIESAPLDGEHEVVAFVFREGEVFGVLRDTFAGERQGGDTWKRENGYVLGARLDLAIGGAFFVPV